MDKIFKAKAMKKVLIVYWSSSGNTELMAKGIAAGAGDAGAEVLIKAVTEATADMVKEADAPVFGCPAMGDEVRSQCRELGKRLTA
ncbi:MAG: flavodoxin domain-containing protein [Spirochaetaceae bacterium]|jgi:flavodoxin|nr:flavodoxin domain-containing protein [Spirochaetaceae bacterium]